MKSTRSLLGALLLACLLLGRAFAADAPAITLAVDATDAPRNLLHVQESIAVAPGNLTLFYPKWIPGEHGPTGPVVDVAGLKITAGNAVVPWRRDPVEMHAIKLTVPTGVDRLDVRFDFILPPTTEGFSSGASSSSQLAVINWNQVVLYSADVMKDALKAGVAKAAPLVLLAENREFFTSHGVKYHGGLRYPWLERDAAKPDLLTKIFSPLVAAKSP